MSKDDCEMPPIGAINLPGSVTGESIVQVELLRSDGELYESCGEDRRLAV